MAQRETAEDLRILKKMQEQATLFLQKKQSSPPKGLPRIEQTQSFLAPQRKYLRK